MCVIAPRTAFWKAILILLCAVVMAITLTAGLWPFSFRIANQVSWRPQQDGLFFGPTGMAISSGKFAGLPTDVTQGCSIELWVEPALTFDSSTLLSFYDPSKSDGISVRQSGDDLVFSRGAGDPRSALKSKNVYLEHVFARGRRVQITLTSANGALQIYLDGVLRKTTKNLEMRGSDFSGVWLLANTPYDNLSWTGTARGLAIYERALRTEEVQQHNQMWRGDKESLRRLRDKPYALYLFDEQSGTILHNAGKAGPNLEIPQNYFVFRPGFLVPFWREFRTDWTYVKDILVNVFGLVPLGICFSALFAWTAGRERSLRYATVLGFCVSLTIEILQRFIPTRFSGTTDLITNTLGTALGARLYLHAGTQRVLTRLGWIEGVERTTQSRSDRASVT